VAVLLPEWLQSADKLYDALGPLADVLRTVLPPAALKYVAKHYLVAYAMFVMLLLVFSPSGIIGFFEKRFAAARKAEPPATEVKVA
jgi:ABC-type branched-subunit amino acid transport system permease subunit